MRRSSLTSLIAAPLLAWPVVGRAQQTARVARVGVLWHAANEDEAQAGGQHLGITVKPTEVKSPDDLPRAFSEMRRAGLDGLVTGADLMLYNERIRLAALADSPQTAKRQSGAFSERPGSIGRFRTR
jgi:hypothetical protein